MLWIGNDKIWKILFIKNHMNKNRKIIEHGLYIYWMTCILFEYERAKKLHRSTESYAVLAFFERFLKEFTRAIEEWTYL